MLHIHDNNDRFVYTDNGKDTMHDTVAIAYQLKQINPPALNLLPDLSMRAIPSSGKRKRSYPSSPCLLEPYRKKPRYKSNSLVPLDDATRNSYTDCTIALEAQMKDFL